MEVYFCEPVFGVVCASLAFSGWDDKLLSPGL